jgi:hypothetical protein
MICTLLVILFISVFPLQNAERVNMAARLRVDLFDANLSFYFRNVDSESIEMYKISLSHS